MAERPYSTEERRTIASIFFTVFDKSSLDEIRAILGNRIGKSTISRDRKGLRQREAPSRASVDAYAAAMGYADGIDTGDPDVLGAVVDKVISARRRYYDDQPVLRRFTSARHPFPAKVMSRIYRSMDERRWENVVDLIEVFRDGDTIGNYESLERYFEFYLGLAHRNLGDLSAALEHFRRAYEMTPEGTNEERDFLSYAAADYALALQESARPLPKPQAMDHILSVAVQCMPENFPDVLVNVMVVASRMPDGYFGISAERVASKIHEVQDPAELQRLRSILMAQIELKDLHEDGMFIHVITAIDERIAKL